MRFPTTGCSGERAIPTITTAIQAVTTAPMWNPFSYRFNGTYHAPADIVLAGSYSVVSGGWSSWIVNQLAANDPQLAVFGPGTVTSSTGSVQSNPLRTRIRFAYPTRGEGQVLLPATHTVGLKASKRIRLGGTRDLESPRTSSTCSTPAAAPSTREGAQTAPTTLPRSCSPAICRPHDRFRWTCSSDSESATDGRRWDQPQMTQINTDEPLDLDACSGFTERPGAKRERCARHDPDQHRRVSALSAANSSASIGGQQRN